MRYRKQLLFLLSALLISYFIGCHRSVSKRVSSCDLSQIMDSGKLVVLTLYGSTSYFNYRGQDMGVEYDLAHEFAQSLGLELVVKTANTVPDLIHQLMIGDGDLIAYTLPIKKERKDSLLFCGKEYITHQVLVQRSYPSDDRVTDVTQLIGKKVYVEADKYYNRLVNLNSELGGGIEIERISGDSLNTEDLVRMVAEKEIDYTIADSHFAQLNKTYYSNLNVDVAISFDQRTSWAVRASSPQLAQAIDEWYNKSQTTLLYNSSLKRYFEKSKERVYSPILSVQEGKISPFDHLFKRYSQKIDWDWRLLASLAFNESRFDTTAVSWVGAKGLMQLMPTTAEAMGVPLDKIFYVEPNLRGAVRYIALMNKSLRMIEDSVERKKFILASYNAGLGHVYDAMALAKKYGKDDHVWMNNVEKFLLLKNKKKYYNDPVCRNGYFRGYETYNFVRDIIERYHIYKEFVK